MSDPELIPSDPESIPEVPKKKGHDRRAQHGYDRALAIADIIKMIDEYGVEAGAVIARTRYPKVDPSTWSRWMQQVKARPVNRARELINRAVDIIPADVLPAAPSPAVIARSPGSARTNLDFMGKLERLYADGEMLRDFSVTVNPVDGTEKIKIANFFGQSIKIRSDLLERWIQASQMLYDWQQMTGFYDTIVQEIAKLDPETSQRIMERLAELNKDKGFTV